MDLKLQQTLTHFTPNRIETGSYKKKETQKRQNLTTIDKTILHFTIRDVPNTNCISNSSNFEYPIQSLTRIKILKPVNSLQYQHTNKKLCYRKDDPAMRAI